jgi:hypothetical protein
MRSHAEGRVATPGVVGGCINASGSLVRPSLQAGHPKIGAVGRFALILEGHGRLQGE